MSRPVLMGSLLALAACGAATQPPAGPKYTPANTPEARTACAAEAAAAKQAREALLGASVEEARVAAARAVYQQAECERAAFDALPLEAPTGDELMAHIDAAKAQFENTRNLYQEVARYHSVRWGVAAQVRLGDMFGAFARKLRESRLPGDLRDVAERADMVAQVEETAAALDQRAAETYRAALDDSAAAPQLALDDDEVRKLLLGACAGVARLDPATAHRYPICPGAPSPTPL